MNEIFKIDDNIWNVDDTRIDKLYNKEIDHQQFLRVLRPDDPFKILNGKLTLLTKEVIESEIQIYRINKKYDIEKNSDISPLLLYEQQNKLLKVYPELKDTINEVNKLIADEKNCSNCAKMRYTSKILEKLLSIKYDGRDLSSLDFLTELCYRKLKGEDILVSAIGIPLPQYLTKTYNIKYRSTPRIINNNNIISNYSNNNVSNTTIINKNINNQLLVENSNGIVRPACKNCTTKHLSESIALLNISQAIIQLKELLQGYTVERGYSHQWLAIGHLAEAADEIIKDNPELALEIRNVRLKLMGQSEDAPTK